MFEYGDWKIGRVWIGNGFAQFESERKLGATGFLFLRSLVARADQKLAREMRFSGAERNGWMMGNAVNMPHVRHSLSFFFLIGCEYLNLEYDRRIEK